MSSYATPPLSNIQLGGVVVFIVAHFETEDGGLVGVVLSVFSPRVLS